MIKIAESIRQVLPNGMQIVLLPNENSHTISIGFFVNAGSRDETDANSGVAHFLEHMLFKGTTNRTASELFTELDTMGAIYNAATGVEYTYYYVYGNSNDVAHLLDIMLDIYLNTKLSRHNIQTERNVIVEEHQLRADNPFNKLYTMMHKKIFNGTPMERDVIGNLESIKQLDLKDLVQFKKSMYKPSNTIFVIAGNFNPKAVLNLFRPVLTNLKSQDSAKATLTIENQIQKQSKPFVHIKTNTSLKQVYVLFAFAICDIYKNNRQAIDLIATLLSSGSSSRLSTELREKNGISYGSSAFVIQYTECGVFMIQTVLKPKELRNGIKIILQILSDLKNHLISPDELTKIINITKNKLLYSLADPTFLLTEYGINLLRDDKYNLDNELDRIDKVTREQIQRVAKLIFKRNIMNLFIYGNVMSDDLGLQFATKN